MIAECRFLNFDEIMHQSAQKLEDRLMEFAAMIVDVVEALPNSKAGNHISNRLIRSGV